MMNTVPFQDATRTEPPLALKLIIVYIVLLDILPLLKIHGSSLVFMYGLWPLFLWPLVAWRLWYRQRGTAYAVVFLMIWEIFTTLVHIPMLKYVETRPIGYDYLSILYVILYVISIAWIVKNWSSFSGSMGGFGSKKEWKIIGVVAIVVLIIFLIAWYMLV